ncbi:hypothetical protein B0H13DRAFT_1876893 [Mycena leptocephala]|nr:hypothetical protein B0H13DRAFT_1876893 [Mycena leptocephala]
MSTLSEPDAGNTCRIDFFDPPPSHDECDAAGKFPNACLDNATRTDHFPELQLPTLASAPPPSPGSPQINATSPIEALNTELDPQNIVTSARAWNSPKRTLDYYSTIAIRAKKPKTKWVSIPFLFYYFLLLKSISVTGIEGSEHYLWELIKKSISNSIATGLNTPGWIDFCDSVEADLGAADESESESVAVGWSPSNNVNEYGYTLLQE